ncbi:hypothetical protein [Rickettsiella endosymbiont of Miltochrista miniata]|uniref:hypothetical protein n=1 Tax=Rickettsiella endosymbiont of Miltochrista miniata TaxID=3066239 RepID=UPI00313B6F15
MPLNELIESYNQLLLERDFSSYIKHLYIFGVLLEKDFVQAVEKNPEGTFAEETDKKERFYKYIAHHITESLSNFPPGRVTKESLCTRLWHLQSFLTAWEDPELHKQEDKKLCQAIEHRSNIDEYFLELIYAGLIAEVARTYQEVNNFLAEKKLSEFDLKKGLREHLADCIRSLKSQTPDNIGQIYDEAAKAIASFTPSADKFLHGLGLFLGVTAALAVAAATGGFLFLLLSGVGASLAFAASMSVLMFLANFGANFRLFSIHSTKFLCAMAKSGGITEFIDKEGKRAQLPISSKCILLFGAFVSFAVGLSTASLTIMFGVELVAKLFPMLAVGAFSFPGIVIGILVFGITIALSFVIFKAWVHFLQSPFFLWLENGLKRIFNEIKALPLTQIPNYIFKGIQALFKRIFALSFIQILSYIFKAAFISFALFGLFFLCFAGIPSLVPALGLTASWITGLAAFIGDLPFTVITMCAFWDSLSAFSVSMVNFFSRTEQMPLETEDQRSSLPNNNLFMRIVNALMLLVNAIGRSIQVFNGSIISAIAAIACCFSAIAGTLIKQDKHEEHIRDKASKASKELLIQYGYKTDGNVSVETVPIVSNSLKYSSSSSSSSSCRFFPAANSPSSSASESKLGHMTPLRNSL